MFNKSTAMGADEASTIAAATDRAFNETVDGRPSFNEVWDTNISVQYFVNEADIPTGAWHLGLFDNSDQAGALGYHDYNSEGGPLGKAFVGTDKQVGASPSVTVSHEGFEMAVDPDLIETWFITLSSNDITIYAKELCDPVESDASGFEVTLDDGTKVLVSNYIYPAWADPGQVGMPNAKFDAQGELKGPFQLQPDGYLSVWTPSGGWQQASHAAGRQNPAVRQSVRTGSRLEKRRIGRDEWRRTVPC